MANYKDIKGPVIPVPVPFLENEDVDYKRLEDYVGFLASKKIPAVMTTVGTSRYNLLSWDEIQKCNEALVKGAGEDTISIVANPVSGGLRHAIEFGKHAMEIGADYYLVYFPERHYGEANTYAFFETLNRELDIPMLIHEMPMRNGMGGGQVQYSIDLLDRLLELENVVGMKEEALDKDYSNKILDKFGEDAVIIGAGGGMSRYLYRDFDRGSRAFLGGLGNFHPELELEFYNSLVSGDRENARRIVEEIELPYFEEVVPIGWHPALKAALSLKGFCLPNERKPMVTITDKDREVVKNLLQKNGWL